MATWYLGPLRVGQGIARRAGIAGGVAAVAGGLALGVATAADPGAVQAAAGPATAASPAAAKSAPRLPLHQVIAARLSGQRPAAQALRPAQRLIVGRLLSFPDGAATVQTARGQVVAVHTNAQT